MKYSKLEYNPNFPILVLPHKTTENKKPTSLLQCDDWHEQLELHLIEKGSVFRVINGVVTECHAGDIIVTNPIEPHYLYAGSEDNVYHCIMFDSSFFRTGLDLIGEKFISPLDSNVLLFENYIFGDKELAGLIRMLADEYDGKSYAYELKVKGAAFLILSILVRKYVKKHSSIREQNITKGHLKTIGAALAYINENYTKKLTVADIAARASLSEYYFCRLFKKYKKVGVFTYITALRIEYSKSLLTSGELQISEIAERCGFADGTHFSHSFKNQTGLSPKQYQKKARGVL